MMSAPGFLPRLKMAGNADSPGCHGWRCDVDIPDLELEQTDEHHTYDGCNPRKNWDREEMGRVQAEVLLAPSAWTWDPRRREDSVHGDA